MKYWILFLTLFLNYFVKASDQDSLKYVNYYNSALKSINNANYINALSYFDSAQMYRKNKYDSLQLYNAIGSIYMYRSDYYTAINYFDSAAKLIDNESLEFSGYLFINYGLAYTQLLKFTTAISYYNKADKVISDTYKSYLYHDLGICYNFWQKPDSASYWFKKAYEYQKQHYGLNNINTLLSALQYIEETNNFILLNQIKPNILKSGSNRILGWYYYLAGNVEKAEQYYQNDYYMLVKLYSKYNQPIKAIQYIDSLRNNYLALDSKLFLQANERLIYKNAIEQTMLTDSSKAFKLALKSRANILRLAVDSVFTNMPESYNYFDFDSVIYLFYYNASVTFYKIKADSVFWNQYNNFLSCFNYTDIHNNYYSNYKRFCSSAYFLYNKLVPFPSKEMLIIPDNKLHYIPFECLLTQPADTTESNYKVLNYLMNSCSISYDYLLRSHSADKGRKKIIAFAPDYSLLFPQKAMRKIKMIGGKVFIHGKATNDKIIQGDILHINTHYHPIDRYIRFSDADLYIDSLAFLPKSLVILATCYSGLGKENKGEGVFSPGRAFYMAGAKSIIESIWKGDGQSTYLIINEFYKNLKKGNRKSIALTNSKIQYLHDCPHFVSHPYYWAHLRVFGNDSSLLLKRNNNLLLVISTIIVVIVIIKYRFRLRGK